MSVVTVHATLNTWWALAGWLLLTNVVANVYPIMLQRHNRRACCRCLRGSGAGGELVNPAAPSSLQQVDKHDI